MVLGLVVLGFVLMFYSSYDEIKEEVSASSVPVIIWTTEKLPLELPSSVKIEKERNITAKDKSDLEVSIYGYAIATVGEEITLYSTIENNESNISSYLWCENKNLLGTDSRLSFSPKEGEHTIELIVTDVMGQRAKNKKIIDIYASYDKKTFSKHQGCGCEAVTYSYYNEEGKLAKLVSQSDRVGVEIEEYGYDEKGNLLSKHYLNYYDTKDDFISDKYITYDTSGNEIDVSGKEYDYNKERIASFHTLLKYDEKSNLIEKRYETEGGDVEIERYENRDDYISERYKDGVLVQRLSRLSRYDKSGNLLEKREEREDVDSGLTQVADIETYTYDSENHLLSKVLDYDGDGKANSTEYYFYDEQGHKIKETSLSGEDSSETLYAYDSQGNLIQEVSKSQSHNSLNLYAYNEAGQKLLSQYDRDGDGYFEQETRYIYDENRVLVKSEYFKNGSINGFNAYNSRGKIVERNSGSYTHKFFYDEVTGGVIKKVLEESNREVMITYYDNSGEMIKQVDGYGEVLYSVDVRH